MALEGSLSDFGLADILQLIYFQRKTGVLGLSGKMDSVRLTFIDGNITGAESKRKTDDNRLGKILVKKGLIKDTDLQAVLDEKKKTGLKLGAALTSGGLVSREIVTEILKSQVTDLVINLFSWKQGTYEFSAQGVPQEQDLPFSLDTQHILMEGLRIVDEWSVIRERLSPDAVFRRMSQDTDGLSEEEKEILAHVDVENDVSSIIDLSGKDSFEVSKTLLGLADKGVIESIESLKAVTTPAETPETGPGRDIYKYLTPLAVVVSLLLSVFSVYMMSSGDVLKTYRTALVIEQLRARIETYKIVNSTYPKALDAVSPGKDLWGRPFIYSADGLSYTVSSAGPDGREGTDDDIR
ncbi:MAG: DUF4388 domain-containing protein [Nitrospirae bacterium]|nr:DUF4388 domain-containing protein [Nitrospirota bacterium]